MKILEYFSNYAILIFLLITIIIGLKEKKNIFDLFIKGAEEGAKIALKLFPTLLGLMVAVSMLSNSKVLESLTNILSPIFKIIGINPELTPLIVLRPISGSTTTAIATELMKKFGPDGEIGLIASTIMGATETTIFVAALYSSAVKIKDAKEVIAIGLIADFIGIMASIFAYNIGILN
ncbi:MAG: nucleoside recognition domain-containing protein [Candidatus Scatovivens sp.]